MSRELSDVRHDLEAQQAKVRQQTKELKDALAAKKLAMEEFTELNVKVCVCVRCTHQQRSRVAAAGIVLVVCFNLSLLLSM